jgi:cytochrome P450
LNVISGAGFGVPFEWEESSKELGNHHKLSFQGAVSSVLRHLPAIVLLPRLLWKLPIKFLRETEIGYNEFGTYMRENLDKERALLKESERQNLLAALVKHAATEDSDKAGTLTDSEIIGNTFIFLIAGHETT